MPSFNNFQQEGEGRCTCGATIKIGYTDGRPTVIHPNPACETFMRYESPIDYMKHLNDTLEAQANNPMLLKVEPCDKCLAKLRRINARSGEAAMCAAVGPTMERCSSCREQLPQRPGRLVTRMKPVN